MPTIYFSAEQTGLSYPSSGQTATYTFSNDPNLANFGYTPALGAGVLTLQITNGNPANARIVASLSGNPATYISNSTGWLYINVPVNGVVSYYIESTNGTAGTLSVDSFFEKSDSFTNRTLSDYTLNNGKNMSVEFGLSGTRNYTIPNLSSGYISFFVEGTYDNSNISSIIFTNGINTVTVSNPTNPNQSPALLVTAGQNTDIRVECPQNGVSFFITGQYYQNPTFDILKSAHPEIANSLTLNPTQSALMLDAGNRAKEALHANHARVGEFGYEVYRRLRLLDYI